MAGLIAIALVLWIFFAFLGRHQNKKMKRQAEEELKTYEEKLRLDKKYKNSDNNSSPQE